jgi:competence protein ComEA
VSDEEPRTLTKKAKPQPKGKQTKRAQIKERRKTMRRTLVTLALLAGLAAPVLADSEKGGVVNINTASVQELKLLPRVGPALAQRILEFREKNGPFKSPEELMRVKGIGEKTFDLMKPYVTTSGPTTLKQKVASARKRAQGQKATGGN